MRPASSTSLAALLALAAIGACGDDSATTGDEENIAETKGLFGDDRLADVLAKDPSKAPSGYAALEERLGIGRACKRKDSKEIYVVEESSSREGGVQETTDQILPRAIVTGCNEDPTDPASAIQSFGLMVALFSSPDDLRPGRDHGPRPQDRPLQLLRPRGERRGRARDDLAHPARARR
jgi:hypothetical protein